MAITFYARRARAGPLGPPCQAALCAAASIAILLAAGAPDAEAERTSLRLDPVPRLVVGEHATFTGTLLAASGRGVPGALVEIKDNDPGPDDLIATARTGGDGRFAARVVVKDWDRWGGASDIYAVFEGGGGFSKSRSAEQQAPVLPAGSGGAGGSVGQAYSGAQQGAPGGYAPSSHPTQIRLHFDRSSVYAGETVTFSGTLTSNGRPLSGATVHIKENDRLWRDAFLATTKTDRNGRYSVEWRASAALIERDFDVYAVFEGSGSYLRDRTPDYTLTVAKRAGSITLDPIPRGVHVGDLVTFSGSLSLQGIDTTNVIVYIKDEDFANPDDLLATAYVDGGGRYAVTWVAKKVDADRVADIYAVFEGDSGHYRLTTCDANPTRFFGGLCRDTRPLTTWPARPVTPPGPPNAEYVELDYTISFRERPTVAISPSPDSYAKARHHIMPTREGIETLSSELAARHGGDWLVNFEVLTPSKWRADARADIVVNIVTGDDDSDCDESFGWAPGAPKVLPIQIHVCSTSDDRLRASSEVMRTATHEFAHAVGLGHAFNKKNDMMCSVENSRSTCPGTFSNKELRPSSLVLDAMATMYGRDGYMVPNNSPGRYFMYPTQENTYSQSAPSPLNSAAESDARNSDGAESATWDNVDMTNEALRALMADWLTEASRQAHSVKDTQGKPPTLGYARNWQTYPAESTHGSLVVLETASGRITIELFDEDAPEHARNMRSLADSGFYDMTLFHRIIPGFMIQGGDPNSIDGDPSTWGTGGPAHNVHAEFNDISHMRGIVSMARSSDPDSAGSQFFIVDEPSTFLDKQYTVFGRLATAESYDTLNAIASLQTNTSDVPTEAELARIVKAYTVPYMRAEDLLDQEEPARVPAGTGSVDMAGTYIDLVVGVSFWYLAGWEVENASEAGAPRVLAIKADAKSKLPPAMIIEDIGDVGEIDEYVRNRIEDRRGSEVYVTLSGPNEMTLGGGRSLVTVSAEIGQSGEQVTKFHEIIVMREHTTYSIVYMSTPEDYEEYLPHIDAMTKTIEFFDGQ